MTPGKGHIVNLRTPFQKLSYPQAGSNHRAGRLDWAQPARPPSIASPHSSPFDAGNGDRMLGFRRRALLPSVETYGTSMTPSSFRSSLPPSSSFHLTSCVPSSTPLRALRLSYMPGRWFRRRPHGDATAGGKPDHIRELRRLHCLAIHGLDFFQPLVRRIGCVRDLLLLQSATRDLVGMWAISQRTSLRTAVLVLGPGGRSGYNKHLRRR